MRLNFSPAVPHCVAKHKLEPGDFHPYSKLRLCFHQPGFQRGREDWQIVGKGFFFECWAKKVPPWL